MRVGNQAPLPFEKKQRGVKEGRGEETQGRGTNYREGGVATTQAWWKEIHVQE